MNRPSLTHGFAALRVPNYRLFWIGHVVSRAGTWMQQVSLPWLVLALGGSAIELGVVAALEFTPSLFLAPFGGVYADRIDKRRALLVTQSLAFLQVVVLLALTASGVITIPLIMILSFALGLVNAADTPLRQALAADLVPKAILGNAIALTALAFNGARIVGPAIAGLSIAVGTTVFGTVSAGVAFNLGINAISYAAPLMALARMDTSAMRQLDRLATPAPVFNSLREGVTHAVHTPIVLWSLCLVAVVATFGINFRILLPLFTQDVLHLGAATFGALYAALGVGALAGAVTLAFLHQRRFVALMITGSIAFGLALLGLVFATSAVVAGALLVGAGFSQMLLTNTANAAIQANVTDALRGRVVALYVTVMQGSTPIGGVIAGALVEYGTVPLAFFVGSIMSVTAGATVWVLLRATSRPDS